MSLVPSEEWPPYRWLWTTVVLARDPVTREPTPYTHGMRRNPLATAATMLVVLLGTLRVAERFPKTSACCSFALGALAGHVFW